MDHSPENIHIPGMTFLEWLANIQRHSLRNSIIRVLVPHVINYVSSLIRLCSVQCTKEKLNNIKPHEIIEYFFSNLLAFQNQLRVS